MGFLKKSFYFGVTLGTLGILAYFSSLNFDYIYVNIPWLGEFKTRAAIVFLGSFLAGSLFTYGYFGVATFRKSLKIRQLTKQIATLENHQPRELTKPSKEPARDKDTPLVIADPKIQDSGPGDTDASGQSVEKAN